MVKRQPASFANASHVCYCHCAADEGHRARQHLSSSMKQNRDREDGGGRGRAVLLSIFRGSEDKKIDSKRHRMMRNQCARKGWWDVERFWRSVRPRSQRDPTEDNVTRRSPSFQGRTPSGSPAGEKSRISQFSRTRSPVAPRPVVPTHHSTSGLGHVSVGTHTYQRQPARREDEIGRAPPGPWGSPASPALVRNRLPIGLRGAKGDGRTSWLKLLLRGNVPRA